MTEKPRIGFLGVGLMGHGAAKNILERGYPLTVLGHRNRAPVDDLVRRGATEAKDAAALAEASDVVIICVPSGVEMEAAFAGPRGLMPGARPGMIFIDATTNDPTVTRKVGAELEGDRLRPDRRRARPHAQGGGGGQARHLCRRRPGDDREGAADPRDLCRHHRRLRRARRRHHLQAGQQLDHDRHGRGHRRGVRHGGEARRRPRRALLGALGRRRRWPHVADAEAMDPRGRRQPAPRPDPDRRQGHPHLRPHGRECRRRRPSSPRPSTRRSASPSTRAMPSASCRCSPASSRSSTGRRSGTCQTSLSAAADWRGAVQRFARTRSAATLAEDVAGEVGVVHDRVRKHARIGDHQPVDAVDAKRRVDDARRGSRPMRQVPLWWWAEASVALRCSRKPDRARSTAAHCGVRTARWRGARASPRRHRRTARGRFACRDRRGR